MNLQRAIEIAATAHGADNQVDKGGQPYILHPLRVMMSLDTEDEMIVGVLHDVVEDCQGWDFARLRQEGFSEQVMEAIASVTKTSEDEDYGAFVARAKSNPIGRKVKVADIEDNLDVTRIGNLTEKDMTRLNKYKTALAFLKE